MHTNCLRESCSTFGASELGCVCAYILKNLRFSFIRNKLPRKLICLHGYTSLKRKLFKFWGIKIGLHTCIQNPSNPRFLILIQGSSEIYFRNNVRMFKLLKKKLFKFFLIEIGLVHAFMGINFLKSKIFLKPIQTSKEIDSHTYKQIA